MGFGHCRVVHFSEVPACLMQASPINLLQQLTTRLPMPSPCWTPPSSASHPTWRHCAITEPPNDVRLQSVMSATVQQGCSMGCTGRADHHDHEIRPFVNPCLSLCELWIPSFPCSFSHAQTQPLRLNGAGPTGMRPLG